MRQVLGLTRLLIRAYVRDRTAVFFSFFLPFLFMVIFGFLNFGALGRVDLAIVDEAANADSARLIEALRQVPSLRIGLVDRTAMARELRRSEKDLAIVIPADFRIAPARPGATVPTMLVYENEAAPQEVAVGRAIVGDVIDRMSFAASGVAPIVTFSRETVSGVRLRYVDFLVPGILGLSVMQLNVISVAFGLVTLKARGVLRRIFATPVDPRLYVASHGLMRMLLSTMQVAILLGVAFALFQVRVVGSLADLFVMSLIGALPFLMQGFALAGWADNENQVAPIANLITLPQFFLSGVFFPKEAAPDAIEPVTAYLPLTLVNDALREIATQGATLWDVRLQIAGLLVWTVVGFALAVRFLRFETS